MAAGADPVGSGFVKSLARPGGNITGVSNLGSEVSAKQLEMLLSIAPKLSRVAMLLNPTNPISGAILKNVQSAAKRVNVIIVPVEARSVSEIDQALSVVTRENARAIIVGRDALFHKQVRQIAELATKNHLPSVASIREYVEAGGLMSYGVSLADLFRRAATYVDKILKGAEPGELPIELPTKFELVINGSTAKALGLTLTPALLTQADKVIE